MDEVSDYGGAFANGPSRRPDEYEEDGEDEDDEEQSQIDEDDEDDEEADADGDDDEDDDEDEDDDSDDEEDDDDDDDEDDDDEEEDDDEAMDVDDDASPSPRSTSPTTYLRKADARRRAIHPARKLIEAKAYSIEPAAACPHAAHVHAMALSADGTVLLSGGSDGHVRRYDVYATMNGKSMLTLGVRHGFVEGVTKGGVMHSWWANEEVPAVKRERGRDGSDDDDDDDDDERLVSPVHSLAIQKDALWALSGTESGNINLTSIRHEPGVTQHVLRKHKGAVSAMALANNDTELISGGWDSGVYQWDLHTGQVVRSYGGHGGQISSLSFRPLGQKETISRRQSPSVAISLRRSESVSAKGKAEQAEGKDVDMAAAAAAPDKDSAQEPEPEQSPSPTSPRRRSRSARADGDDTNLPSPSTAAGPAPSAEDLAFEAELQKSLGIEASGGVGEDGLPDVKSEPQPASKQKRSGAASSSTPSRRGSNAEEAGGGDGEGDNDSLFGGGSDEDGDGDADADAEADSEADADGDADGDGEAEEDDDQPVSRSARPDGAGVALSKPSGGVNLPGLLGAASASTPSSSATNNLPLPTAGGGSNGSAAPSSSSTPASRLKKPLPLGGLTTVEGFDGDYSLFSNDVFLSTTLGGQALLFDRRVPSKGANVRALPLPEKTPPWCSGAVWAPDGERIYVARRNECVEEWDARMLPSSSSSEEVGIDRSVPWSGARRSSPLHTRTLRLPTSSGPVTSLAFLPNGRHVVCASYDNIRLWDLDKTPSDQSGAGGSGAIPFRIVAGHHGGAVSSLLVDPTSRFLFSASGDRGWMAGATETILISEIDASA